MFQNPFIEGWPDLIFGAVAEFEGARGRNGRGTSAADEKKIAQAPKLMRDRETPILEACEAVGVSRATLYRYVTPDGIPRAR